MPKARIISSGWAGGGEPSHQLSGVPALDCYAVGWLLVCRAGVLKACLTVPVRANCPQLFRPRTQAAKGWRNWPTGQLATEKPGF
ncbi:MAG: hypothetical protein MUC60_14160 [Oscillatoria sp. Prado101]|nr:hypothetical protein [Oscillatoria sp. Prado101]